MIVAMLRLIVVTLLTGFLIGPVVAADAPRRVVSINVCADQLLVALADPEQILSLSVFAADPSLSYLAADAARFRHDAGGAETVVALKPDLVLAGRYTKAATREILTRLGYRVVELDAVRSIDESIRQAKTIALVLGHPERGEALATRIEAARQAARASVAGPTRPTVANYQRRGYVTGANTLTTDLLATVGLTNDGGRLAGRSGGFVSLEKIIAAPPDFILVDQSPRGPADQGSALLAHPALADLYAADRRIVLPGRLTVCGGPSLPEALATLATAASRLGTPQ